MIIKFKKDAGQEEIDKLKIFLKEKDIEINEITGNDYTIFALMGNVSTLDKGLIRKMHIVDDIKTITKPYKKASRDFNPKDRVITLDNGLKIGGGNFAVMAGPCSVESEEQVVEIAKMVKKSGANVLRGGAFKPRTSPYSFQGLGLDGLKLLEIAKKETDLPIISEIMDKSNLKYFENVDILQVGARNMQNYDLLKELGKIDKPVLLKRGLSATYEELLMSAEYIMANGNEKVILCERGIRTYEQGMRNTFDISTIPYIHENSNLSIIADPSHATGYAKYVEPVALSAVAAKADGLIIEVHNDPENALCDGAQSLTPEQFDNLMKKIKQIRKVVI